MLNNINYIISAAKTPAPIKYNKLSIEKFNKLKSSFSSIELYRGSNTKLDVTSNYLIQSTGITRNSDFNLFNYVIDNNIAKGWEGYPKRSKSIFCSDNADTASIYGHFIQPIHINNDIIVAYTDETNDFWLSVVDYACKLGYYNRVFSSHNLNLLYLIAKFGLNLDIHSCDNINPVFNGISVSKFTDAVTNLDNFIFSKTVSEVISIFEECKRNDIYIFDIHLIIALINKNMTFMSYFKSNTPYNLKIRNCKGSDLSSIQLSNNEIWFEGSALISNVKYSDDWI